MATATVQGTGVGVYSPGAHATSAPNTFALDVTAGTAGAKILTITKNSILFQVSIPSDQIAAIVTALGGTP